MSPPAKRPLPPAAPIECLEDRECRRLLDETPIGRLALPGARAPLLRPVNFALLGGSLVVRTGDGAILAAARRGDCAAFEIDGFDPLEHTGWSVLVDGKLSELPSENGRLLEIPSPAGRRAEPSPEHGHVELRLRPWASGTRDCFVGLSLDGMSGIRIPPGRGNR